MNCYKTDIEDVFVIEPDCHSDNRGFFMETFSKQNYQSIGIDTDFIQDNLSYSALKGTLRGIHYQNDPHSQAKIVSCIKGKIIDIAVDLRKGSPTYKKWVYVELSENNKKQIYIPRGFGHAFITLTDDVLFLYKVDNYYSKDNDRGIKYDDPDVNIDWNKISGGLEFILSEKDISNPSLKDSDCNYIYKK